MLTTLRSDVAKSEVGSVPVTTPAIVVNTLPFQGSVQLSGMKPLSNPIKPPTVAPVQSVSQPQQIVSPMASSKESWKERNAQTTTAKLFALSKYYKYDITQLFERLN